LPFLEGWCESGAALRWSRTAAATAGTAMRWWDEAAGAVGTTTTTVAKIEGVPVAAAAAILPCVQVVQLVGPVGSAT